MRNMASGRVGHVIIAVHNARAPSDEEWEAMMALSRLVAPCLVSSIAITDGGSPAAHQRDALNKYLAGAQRPVAVVSASPLIRGAVTTLSWFNSRLKVFPPTDLAGALKHVECSDEAGVRAEIQRLAAMIDGGRPRAVPEA